MIPSPTGAAPTGPAPTGAAPTGPAPTGASPTGDDHVVIALDACQLGLAAGVGRVVSAGPRAQGLIDRRVLVGPIDPCGECDVCRRGGAAVCPLATRRDALDGVQVTASGRWVVPLGDGLVIDGPAAAAVAGDLALAYTLYARTGAAPRDPVVVVGVSPIARFLVEILVAKGIAPVVIADPGPWADWLAARQIAIAPADDPRPALASVFAAQGLGTKPWRVLCASPDAVALAAELAGPRATLSLLADAARALPGALLAREVAIIGVAGAHPDLVVEAAALCVKGDIDLVAATVIAGQHDSEDPAAAPPRTRVRVVAP